MAPVEAFPSNPVSYSINRPALESPVYPAACPHFLFAAACEKENFWLVACSRSSMERWEMSRKGALASVNLANPNGQHALTSTHLDCQGQSPLLPHLLPGRSRTS